MYVEVYTDIYNIGHAYTKKEPYIKKLLIFEKAERQLGFISKYSCLLGVSVKETQT